MFEFFPWLPFPLFMANCCALSEEGREGKKEQTCLLPAITGGTILHQSRGSPLIYHWNEKPERGFPFFLEVVPGEIK